MKGQVHTARETANEEVDEMKKKTEKKLRDTEDKAKVIARKMS